MDDHSIESRIFLQSSTSNFYIVSEQRLFSAIGKSRERSSPWSCPQMTAYWIQQVSIRVSLNIPVQKPSQEMTRQEV